MATLSPGALEVADVRERERRFALLARLADETLRLEEPRDIIIATMRALREHLRADRCAWAEVEEDEDHFTFLGDDAAPGVSRAVGRFPVSAFGADALRALQADRPFVWSDAVAHLPLSASAEAYRRTGIRAVIAVPLHRGGRLVAGVGVHMLTPRAWTRPEVSLVQEVSARCWESLERARVTRALRESEARYRTLVDNQSEMLCRFRVDGTILFVNSAYARAFDTTPEALQGQGFWAFIAPADRDAVRAQLDRLTPDTPQVVIENRVETAQGERWTLWTNRALLFDEEGRVIEAQSSGIDITERKRMEEALREADRRKDEFLAMLAHELRAPLSPLRNAAEILRRSANEGGDQRRAREVIERQVQHLGRLVDDLLDVSRITHGRIRLLREPLELGAVARAAVEASRPLLDGRGLRLTLSLPSAPLTVHGDGTRLQQVLGNLLHNAAKYTDEGGQIWLSAAREGQEAVLRVRDSGVGIPADLLPHVFDLFTQAERSLDRAQGGLGIGLTLVRRLVEIHGGRVEAWSGGAGQGSEFVVRLPLATAAPGPAPAESPAPKREAPRRPLRILVVEDHPDAADMLALLLSLSGHEVRVAYDGPEALDVAPDFGPEVVLCDIGLPGMSGYELAAELRAASEPALTRARLVALSGYGQSADRRRAREAGFDEHLTKPVEPAALDALLVTLTSELDAADASQAG